MSLLAAWIVVLCTIIAGTAGVTVVSAWSEGYFHKRALAIAASSLTIGLIVQLPLPDGPELANVPVAFAQVIDALLS